MDNLTHAVLSGGLVALIVPAARRRAALLIGAVIGNLPDLDVFWPWHDAVDFFTGHRGATHSLLVLPWVGLLTWFALRWIYRPSREAPWAWLLAVMLALLVHPLIDACTVYGTQLWWPLQRPPVMGSLLFIIDPAFTLPMLVAAIAAWRLRERPRAGFYLALGLAFSATYLGWAALAKSQIEAGMRADLANRGLTDAKLLSVPTPFNTLLWRVLVVRADGDYYEGLYSFVAPAPSLILDHYPGERSALADIADSPAVQRLQWFTQDFYRVDVQEGHVVFVDLRMGQEPTYMFRFIVGDRRDGKSIAAEPRQLDYPDFQLSMFRLLWQRLWHPKSLPLGVANPPSA